MQIVKTVLWFGPDCKLHTPDWKVCKLRNLYHFCPKFCAANFRFRAAAGYFARSIFTFFIVSYFSRFFLAFPCGLLCNIISCAAKMCICVADSYIFGILRVSTRILSEIAQPRSRLHSTNFPVWCTPEIRKFTSKYIEHMKTARPTPWLCNTNFSDWGLDTFP